MKILKILFFFLSLTGITVTGYFTIEIFSDLSTFGQWLLLAMRIVLFTMCIVGVILNYGWHKVHSNRIRYIK
jgi:hypothetical protein